jgi:hypothetical protein
MTHTKKNNNKKKEKKKKKKRKRKLLDQQRQKKSKQRKFHRFLQFPTKLYYIITQLNYLLLPQKLQTLLILLPVLMYHGFHIKPEAQVADTNYTNSKSRFHENAIPGKSETMHFSP